MRRYSKIALVFLASVISPGLGYLLLNNTKRFFLVYGLCLFLSFPSLFFLRWLSELFYPIAVPGLFVLSAIFFGLYTYTVWDCLKKAAQPFFQHQSVSPLRAVVIFLSAILCLGLGLITKEATRYYLFDIVKVQQGSALEPTVASGDTVLILRPLELPQKGDIVLLVDPNTQQRKALQVAALPNEWLVLQDKDIQVGSDEMLFIHRGEYIGPLKEELIEGVFHQVYWSKNLSRLGKTLR